jgi:hypothetical protein
MPRDLTARKRAAEALQRAAEVSAALARVGRELIASLDTPTILERLCRLTTEVPGCECAYVTLWKPEEGAYVPVANQRNLLSRIGDWYNRTQSRSG